MLEEHGALVSRWHLGMVAVPAFPKRVTAGPEDVSAGRGPVACMKGMLNEGMDSIRHAWKRWWSWHW